MSLFGRITRMLNRSPGANGNDAQWPFQRGRYRVVDATAAVVVATLENTKLADDLAALAPEGLCMACPLTGGRSDIEKLAHALISNMSIQHLVCAGDKPRKPATLSALQALFAAPPDELSDAMAAAGASKMRLTSADVTALRKQVQFSDLSGCAEIDTIIARVRDLAGDTRLRTTGFVAPDGSDPAPENRVIAADNVTHALVNDKAGYFRISINERGIAAEHYNSKDELLRIIEGSGARSICLTLIRNGWVSKLDHAAYLGRELTRAELALRNGSEFIQDADGYHAEP